MMLSSPHKRFGWLQSERTVGFTFFGTMVKRRRAERRLRVKERKMDGRRWKPAPWTPWLWVK